MSDSKIDQTVKLSYDNWYLWDHHINSTIRRKNASVALDPEPVDPSTVQQTATTTTSPDPNAAGTSQPPPTATQPTTEEMKIYRDELKEWKTANNVAAGVILGALSEEIKHIINPKESAKDMYNKLQAAVIKQSSGSSAFGIRIELIDNQYNDVPTMENFEKHLTFYRSKNASLNAVNAGFDDSFLAFILLRSFHSNDDPIWPMASTNIVTSDTPINQWSFDQVAGKLREALRNSIRSGKKPASNNNQAALNATADKTAMSRYSGPPCTYPGCYRPKTHATANCWVKEKEKRRKQSGKSHKAKKAKKRAVESSSESDSSSDSDSDSEPPPKKRQDAHRSEARANRAIVVLKATSPHIRSCHGKATTGGLFVAHPDSGASNHMTHKRELFDSASFKTLSKPIPISLGDDSEIFATGKGTLRLLFNVNGKQKEGQFKDVLFVPDLKVTLLSVGQSARLPHCKVVFDNNVCEYIDKDTNEIIARAFATDDGDLYTLDATPVTQKVTANLASPPFRSIDINILHRRLGHLGIDNCRLMVNHQMVDGVDRIVGTEAFCEGCAYGCSK